MTHIDAGVGVFKKEILNFIPAGKKCSLEEEIFPKLIQAKELYSFPLEKRFYDIGSPEGLKLIREVLK
jgi:NDP-sugar pyrophosphorylase family protein